MGCAQSLSAGRLVSSLACHNVSPKAITLTLYYEPRWGQHRDRWLMQNWAQQILEDRSLPRLSQIRLELEFVNREAETPRTSLKWLVYGFKQTLERLEASGRSGNGVRVVVLDDTVADRVVQGDAVAAGRGTPNCESGFSMTIRRVATVVWNTNLDADSRKVVDKLAPGASRDTNVVLGGSEQNDRLQQDFGDGGGLLECGRQRDWKRQSSLLKFVPVICEERREQAAAHAFWAPCPACPGCPDPRQSSAPAAADS